MVERIKKNIQKLNKTTSKAWERRKKDRPEEILDSTHKILSKDGRTGLSTKRIALEAGISEATIFKYFKDKDDLIEKCYHRMGFDVVNNFKRDLEGIESLYECLLHIARTNFIRLKSNQNIWDIFTHDINKRLKKDSELYKLKGVYEEMVADLFIKAKKNGEIDKKTEISTVLFMFFGPIEYIAIKYRMYGENFNIEVSAKEIVDTIFKAYGKKIKGNK